MLNIDGTEVHYDSSETTTEEIHMNPGVSYPAKVTRYYLKGELVFTNTIDLALFNQLP